ncbi:MAG: DNA-directed RNA polymerase subunit B [Candidatus Thorarchaeota archaeon]|nr:DNA-directed RNA polymerase subunit B [Candidatus Thorarchaeota archaeon]
MLYCPGDSNGAAIAASERTRTSLGSCIGKQQTRSSFPVPHQDVVTGLGIEERQKYWPVIEAYFADRGLVGQHLDSFNRFIDHELQEVVTSVGRLAPKVEGYYVELGEIEVEAPSVREADGSEHPLYPNEARIRNLTYASKLYLNMTPVRKEGTVTTRMETLRIYIGDLPIMLRSEKCLLHGLSDEELIRHGEDPKDPGGYFIINGSERVLVTQEDLAPNRILIEEASKSSSYTHIAKVFSTSRGFRAPVTIERKRTGELRVSFPSVPGKIPLAILLKALGVESDREIVDIISDDEDVRNELIVTIEQSAPINAGASEEATGSTRENALDFIGKRVAVGQTKEYRLSRAEKVLDRYLLPHIGTEPEHRLQKAYYLGQMVERLLELVLGKRQADDKDHYSNKRLKLSGDLLMSLFRVALYSLTRDIKYQLERTAVRGRKPNIRTAVRADVITQRLKHALATGNWVGGKAGVSQLLDRTNYISSLSHLRRVVSPLSRSQPHFEARDLHATHWGKICPNETPEGPNCGLVKNIAMMAYISVGTDEESVERALLKADVEHIERLKGKRGTKGADVFLNGRLVGIHAAPQVLVKVIRQKRRAGEIDNEVNIAYYEDTREVQVNCDAGRVRRPLIIVENGRSRLTEEHLRMVTDGEWGFKDLLRNGIVEFLDAEEEENTLIAMTPEDISSKTTHLEIVPSTILGISAALIPFPERNQSPRNVYMAGMAKQSVGVPASNFRYRADTRSHFFHYPQVPMVKTRPMNSIGYEERPAGQNFVVAILSFEGYNIEDALIMNKASIERGLGRSTFARVYESEERKYPGGQEDKFEVPDRSVRGYRASEAYRNLGEDGIVETEVEVQGGDVLIGRTSPPRFLEEYSEFEITSPNRRETSVAVRHGEAGVVDSVILTETIDGNRLVKVKVRDLRIPELGDKFASRHGQKGVVGYIVPQQDVPFTEDGVVPDLIINPHAIPSRMTIGQILEMIAGKAGCADGKQQDATPFCGVTEEELFKTLHDHGFQHTGREVMYSGVTGQKLTTDIFIGVIYYQRLHHMVADKMHARARGPVQILTRQPTEGRAREGGLRFGEMERDVLIGHGAAILLKGRLLDESDKSNMLVCEECGLIGVYDRNKDIYYCPICGTNARISSVVVSYAFKLLIQEMMSLGLACRLRLKEMI